MKKILTLLLFALMLLTINAQTITTGTVYTTYTTCNDLTVSYTITGTFNAGNIFTAQLSDAAGSFAAPVSIGSLNSQVAGYIPATIPYNSLAGGSYLIRVVSSNPAVIGTDNGAYIYIQPCSNNNGTVIGCSAGNCVYSCNAGFANCNNNGADGCEVNLSTMNWYQDLDGDGYGNAAVTTQACTTPLGYVANNTDCNDGNAAVHPGAAEICGNGIDEDCNGNLSLCITTGSVTTPICPNTIISIPYTITGTYTAGNIFRAELSDASGSFVSPVVIGTIASTAAGTINAMVPSGTAAGSAYGIRVVGTNPAITGTSNSNGNLTINANTNPAVTITGGSPTQSICSGSSITFTAVGTDAGASPTYQWYKNGTATVTGTTYTNATWVNGDVVNCKVTSNGSCPLPAAVYSNSIIVTMENTTANSWVQKADIGFTVANAPVPRYGAVSFSIGNKGYVGTGMASGGKLNDFWEFDPIANTWTQRANFAGTPRYSAVGFSIGNKGYIGTGYDNANTNRNDFYEYDPATNIWTLKAAFAGSARNSATGFCIGSKGYIGTGYDGTAYKNDFYEYDPVANTWSARANFGGTARDRAVGFSIGSKGYIGTGYDGAYKSDFWEFNPASNSWTQKASFSGGARRSATGFSIGSKGYIGTGYTGSVNKNDFWEYIPASNFWQTRAAFGGAVRASATGFSIGGKGYLGSGGSYYTDFGEFDQSLNLWTAKADFGGAGIRTDAVAFNIGNLGYIGTGRIGGATSTKDFWEYNPATNSWTQKANFGGTARYQAVGFSIGNKGYIGTGTGGGYLKDFWEYDPTANVWTQKANFGGVARRYATGFSIGNKGYLGTGYNGTYLNDFWEYDPATDVWAAKTAFGGSARYGATGFSIGSSGYVGCGYNSGTAYNDFWIYNPVANTWTIRANFTGTARYSAVGFSVANKGFIGTGVDASSNYYSDFYEYDPAANTWSSKAVFGGAARSYAVGFSIGSKGYIGTGVDNNIQSKSDLWEYNPSSVTFTITTGIVNGPFCAGASLDVPFTLNVPFSSCASNTFTAQLSNASGSFASPVNIGTLVGNASGTITGAVIPANTPAGTGYRIRVVSSNPVITGTDNGVNITVNTPPTVTETHTGNCAGASIDITAAGSTSYSYLWSSNYGCVSNAGCAFMGSNCLSGYCTSTAEDLSNLQAGTYTVLVTGANNCVSAPLSITIDPVPVADAVNNQVVCHNTTVNAISLTSSTPGTVFNWTNNTTSIGLAASGTGNIPSFVATNSGAFPAVATITVTPSNTIAGNTCTGTPITFTITVNPLPSAPGNLTGPTIVCKGTATSTYAVGSASSATGYNWLISPGGAGSVSSSGGTATVTWNAGYSGMATLYITASNACGNGAQAAYSIAVLPWQTGTVFTESMGTVASSTIIGTYEAANGFDNDGYTMSGSSSNASVNNTNNSTGYNGASGNANLQLTSFLFGTSSSFTIDGINTTGLNNLVLRFGVKHTSALTSFSVSYSTNGTTYTSLTRSYIAPSSSWQEVVVAEGIPQAANLRLRITGPNFVATTTFIDDIRLTYNNEITPTITAGGPTTFCTGGSVTLSPGAVYTGYQWSNNATTSTLNAVATGNYSMQAVGIYGCPSDASNVIAVTATPQPTWYLDADGDLYSDGTTSTACTAPTGYYLAGSLTALSGDCNDNDNTQWQSATLYIDNDNDYYDNGTTTVCYGASIPSGYKAVTQGSDCNDNDNTQWQSALLYIDNDNDNYDNGTAMVCYGNSIPVGYKASTIGSDCDDNNTSVHIAVTPEVSLSVQNGTTTICSGVLATFTASPVNGGTLPTYKWYINNVQVQNGSSSSYTTSSLVNGSLISCELTSNYPCVTSPTSTSNVLTMTVISPTAAPSAPVAITGETQVCSGTSYTYSITPVATATSYDWYVPAGSIVTSPLGGTSISVQFPATMLTGAVKVSARNCKGISAQTALTVKKIAKPATPGIISGPTVVCAGNSYTYSVTSALNVSTYTWTAPANASVTAGQGTNSVTIQYGAGFVSGTVSVIASNCISTSTARTLAIGTVPVAPVITGLANNICNPTTGIVYTASSVAGTASYTWTVTGGTLVSGQGSNSITVDFPASFASATVSVRAVTACGVMSIVKNFAVAQRPATPGVISGPAVACATASNTYSIAAVSGATSYTWTVPAGWTITSGQGTTSVNVTAGANAGNISVTANNSCKPSTVKTLALTINPGCRTARPEEESLAKTTDEDGMFAKIYPNPFTDEFTIEYNSANADEKVAYKVFDITGRLVEVKAVGNKKGNNKITVNLPLEATGLYVIELQQGNVAKRFRLVKE